MHIQVIWDQMYSTASARDTGTLYAARNAIDARNVTVDPHNNYYAAAEFLDKVNSAYLIVGALDYFGMETVEDQPKKNEYTGQPNDVHAKKEYINTTIRQFVLEHVVNQVPELSTEAPTSNELKCRECGKSYIRPHALRNHEQEKHGITPASSSASHSSEGEDRIYNYTHQLLVLLLLRANHNNAIKLGDGQRLLRLYKYFMLFFKVSSCPKYAIAMLHLQAQVNCLLSPRMSYSLTWNRFVNHQGAPDTNHPMNLDIEHDNKSFKNDCHSYRGEITDKSINRVSRSAEKSDAILYNFDETTSVKRPSGRHTRMSTEEDIMLLVEHIKSADVFKKIPGRVHTAFSNMRHNCLEQLDADKLKDWISNSLKKFSKKHFYGT